MKGKGTKRKGVGIDFKRAKSKVGRKAPPPTNATKTTFKSKTISLPSQGVGDAKEGPVSGRGLSLTELMRQSSHYSEKTRRDSMRGLQDLFSHHPSELLSHLGTVVQQLSPRVTDTDKQTRDMFCTMLRTALFPLTPPHMLAAFFPILMRHVSAGITHILPAVRQSALQILKAAIETVPSQLLPFSAEILRHFADVITQNNTSVRSLASLSPILDTLRLFLTACHGSPPSTKKPTAAAEGSEQVGGAGSSVSNPGSDSFPAAIASISFSSGSDSNVWKGVNDAAPSLAVGCHSWQNGATLMASRNVERQASKVSFAPQLVDWEQADFGGLLEDSAAASLLPTFAPLLLRCIAESVPSLSAISSSSLDQNALSVLLSSLTSLLLLLKASPVSDQQGSFLHPSHRSSPHPPSSPHTPPLSAPTGSLIVSQLSKFFPLAAPPVKVPPKVFSDLISGNVIACQIFVFFITKLEKERRGGSGRGEGNTAGGWWGGEGKSGDEVDEGEGGGAHSGEGAEEGEEEEEGWEAAALDFYEQALDGNMLYSEGLSDCPTDRHLAEPHLRTLLLLLPSLLPCVSHPRQLKLLRKFSSLLEASKPAGAMRRLVLSVICDLIGRENVMERSVLGHLQGGEGMAFVCSWLHSLPRLVWTLKAKNLQTSAVALKLLFEIGRRCRVSSRLHDSFCDLQLHLIPFFCTSLPARRGRGKSDQETPASQEDETKIRGSPPPPELHFGPFLALPAHLQLLALSVLQFFPSLSWSLLSSLACCCQATAGSSKGSGKSKARNSSSHGSCATSIRGTTSSSSSSSNMKWLISAVVDVVAEGYARGAVSVEDYLRFLMSLLFSEGEASDAAGKQMKSRAGTEEIEDEEAAAEGNGTTTKGDKTLRCQKASTELAVGQALTDISETTTERGTEAAQCHQGEQGNEIPAATVGVGQPVEVAGERRDAAESGVWNTKLASVSRALGRMGNGPLVLELLEPLLLQKLESYSHNPKMQFQVLSIITSCCRPTIGVSLQSKMSPELAKGAALALVPFCASQFQVSSHQLLLHGKPFGQIIDPLNPRGHPWSSTAAALMAFEPQILPLFVDAATSAAKSGVTNSAKTLPKDTFSLASSLAMVCTFPPLSNLAIKHEKKVALAIEALEEALKCLEGDLFDDVAARVHLLKQSASVLYSWC